MEKNGKRICFIEMPIKVNHVRKHSIWCLEYINCRKSFIEELCFVQQKNHLMNESDIKHREVTQRSHVYNKI